MNETSNAKPLPIIPCFMTDREEMMFKTLELVNRRLENEEQGPDAELSTALQVVSGVIDKIRGEA